MRHVQVEATGGWGLGGSPEGDRRGLSLAGAPRDRSAARRKVSVVLELSRGSDLDSVSRRHWPDRSQVVGVVGRDSRWRRRPVVKRREPQARGG